MYKGVCKISHQLSNNLIDTITTEKSYSSKFGALKSIKRIMQNYSDYAFGTVYVNYDYEVITA